MTWLERRDPMTSATALAAIAVAPRAAICTPRRETRVIGFSDEGGVVTGTVVATVCFA